MAFIHPMDIRRADLNLLPLFEMLVSEGHVSRAASKSGMSQPAMSHALSRLRGMFNDPILVRSRDGMQPTATALRLLPRVREVLSHTEALLGKPRSFEPALCTRTFVLGATDYAASRVLPSIAAELSANAPDARLVVRHVGRSEGIRAVENGEVDVAIGTFPAALSLRSTVLLEEKYICAVWRGNRRVKSRVSLAQYLDLAHVLVEARGDPEGVVDFELARQNRRRHIALVVPHFLTAPTLLRGTDLILTLSEGVLRDQVETSDLRLLAPPLQLPTAKLEMLWRVREDADEAMKWFRGVIMSARSSERHP